MRSSKAAAEEAGDDAKLRVHKSALYLAENFERAPAFVIPCIAQDLSETNQTGVIATLGSIIQAAWSFQLALRARGLGSTWTTLHLGQAQAVADLLGIPDGVTQVSLIPVAYTKGLDFRPATRPPVTEVTHWNRWDDGV
ncbi:MAG TPA: nitroreductase family protein [Solirubrobacterales bacterium]|nr:nitroreductase family protein [Solirubrobacterales bacterium]